jgi:predicted O-methyltransferase YrrM
VLNGHKRSGSRRYDFEDLWAEAASIKGWLTDEQARRLWQEASTLAPGAVVVEIGSHQGRSTVVLAGAVEGSGSVVAIDPFVEGRLFGGQPTRATFEANLSSFGLSSTVRLVSDYSTAVRPGWSEPIDMLYVDGKHDYWTCSDDLRWSRHLAAGGTVLVHDAFSSIGVTLALLVHALPSRELTFVGRDGSLARFRKQPPTRADRLLMVRQVPWWLRNVVIKVLLRLRLRPVARLLGHDGDYDPY